MSNFDSRNSRYARKDVFFLVRVLVKARFPNSIDPGSQIPKSPQITNRYQRNYVENFSALGAIAAEE
jgi:hypothetical protein